MIVTVQGREPRGATGRLTIIYACGDCGTTGTQGEITNHLYYGHFVKLSTINGLLRSARTRAGRAP